MRNAEGRLVGFYIKFVIGIYMNGTGCMHEVWKARLMEEDEVQLT